MSSTRIKICQDTEGTWSVYGTSPEQVSGLPSLSASIDYARKACNAAPATIELYIDGMYIVAHQESGWPKALVSSGNGLSQSDEKRHDRGKATAWSRLMAWLRKSRHLTAEAGRPYVREREASNVVSLKLV
jgi:hypothetical protein